MSYLKFDKSLLVNLEYSLQREILRTNRHGSYACTTIIDCNTRKYHGLLITPVPKLNDSKHVLLSSLDESIIVKNKEFNLGIHKYAGGVYEPKGHKYIRDYDIDDIPKLIYRIGDIVLQKEKVLDNKHERILIKYSILEGDYDIKLHLKPFLAFRNIHNLSKANMFINTKIDNISQGIKMKLYEEYPFLHMQLNEENEFIHVPDWYYGLEYPEEQRRGYNYKEDLFVPGYFEVKINKGKDVIFVAGTDEINPKTIKSKFTKLRNTRTPRVSFENCLINNAEQFIEQRENTTKIIAGYPWFGSWGRDTMISLSGITLALGNIETCKNVLDSYIKFMDGPLFPNIASKNNNAYNSVDAPLWFFYTLQELEKVDPEVDIYKKYGNVMKSIIEGYEKGTRYNIKMEDNGLIYAGNSKHALTWMDAIADAEPVTPRIGMAVEIQALWYNAIVYTLTLAEKHGDSKFLNKWKDKPEKIKNSFIENFWLPIEGYLCDYVNLKENNKNKQIRPNQIIATALDYSMLNKEQQEAIIKIVKHELLTTKGLRTLSPADSDYIPHYEGSQYDRDKAYHQGTVWPWLLEFYAKSLLKLQKQESLPELKEIYHSFHDDMTIHGIGNISEIYDGDPPHTPRGAISQAWSTGALLQIRNIIKTLEN